MLHDLEVDVGQKGSTVRLGTKWLNTRNAELILCVCSDRCAGGSCDDPNGTSCVNCTRVGTAKTIFTWYGIFRDIPARTIEYEHERRSRKYGGLVESMRKAYGDMFNEWSPVVVMIYRRMA